MTILPLKNSNGITVSELREWLKQFPDACEQYTLGEIPTVWMDDKEGCSSPVKSAWYLNRADVLLSKEE